MAQRQASNAVDYNTLSVNIVFTDEEAKNVANVALYTAWAGRTQFAFTLPPQYAQLEPTDIIEITNGGITYAMRITQTKLMRNGQQDVSAVSEDVSAYQFYTPPGQNQNVASAPVAVAPTTLALLDLPAFPTDAVTDSYLRYFVAGLAANWSGAAVYRSDDGGANYNLMVSPYNVQVNHLRAILPPGARVGTVDKFQGQEAPVVLVSMATSSAEDLPRNIEFLYSKNRLNVALSRAQCLAVVVANPKLFEIPCGTVEQMKLVNTFCWLGDYATGG